jgi:hypothetical protein
MNIITVGLEAFGAKNSLKQLGDPSMKRKIRHRGTVDVDFLKNGKVRQSPRRV